MDYFIFIASLGFVSFIVFKCIGDDTGDSSKRVLLSGGGQTTSNSSAGVASTPSSQGEYELIQFDEAMFTGGTTSQRFQERVGRYIHNGYRIHTMNVVVKQGWFVSQKQTYTVLFEKLPQPMSEGAAMLNS